MSAVIVFDGACGFCNRTIMYIARNDKNDEFKFVSNNSDFGMKLLKKYKIKGLERTTIILIMNESIYTKSIAIKKVLLKIPSYKIFGHIMYLVPRIMSDWFYDFISKHRNRIIENDVCEIPSSEIRRKFIL